MIKKLLFSSLIGFSVFAYSNLETQTASTYSTNPPDGNTGAPGQTNCTQCHNGNALMGSDITHDIPSAGYNAGQSYSITVTSTQSGGTTFGFQITSFDAGNNQVGTFLDNNNIGISGNGAYAEHVGSNTSGTDSKTWTFDWVAPAAGTGDVTFYSSTNATNSNGNSSGDVVTLSNSTVSELSITTSITEISPLKVSVFPQPALASDELYLTFSKTGQLKAQIFDIRGKQISSMNSGVNANTPHVISTVNLSKGIYVIKGSVNDFAFVQKIVIR